LENEEDFIRRHFDLRKAKEAKLKIHISCCVLCDVASILALVFEIEGQI